MVVRMTRLQSGEQKRGKGNDQVFYRFCMCQNLAHRLPRSDPLSSLTAWWVGRLCRAARPVTLTSRLAHTASSHGHVTAGFFLNSLDQEIGSKYHFARMVCFIALFLIIFCHLISSCFPPSELQVSHFEKLVNTRLPQYLTGASFLSEMRHIMIGIEYSTIFRQWAY